MTIKIKINEIIFIHLSRAAMSEFKLFVGGLSWNVDEAQLHTEFAKHGEVGFALW